MVLSSVFYRVPFDVFTLMMEQFQQVCDREEIYLRVELRTDDFAEAVRDVTARNGVFLLVVGVDDIHEPASQQALQLGRMAVQKNRDNYVVYSAASNKTMIQMAPYCTHPAGIVTHAILASRSTRLLNEIFRDYKTIFHEEENEDDWINLKVKGAVSRVNINNICAVTSANKMVEVTTLKEKLLVYDSLESIEKKLNDHFVKCHRSSVINVKCIQQVDFQNMTIVLLNGMEVPLSRSFRQAIHQIMEPQKERGA